MSEKVYWRYIHNISQNPESDTEGPFEVDAIGLDYLWGWFRRKTDGVWHKSRRRSHKARLQDGGAVFFLQTIMHCVMIMPEGSALHIKHAPPSHFRKGGPLAHLFSKEESDRLLAETNLEGYPVLQALLAELGQGDGSRLEDKLRASAEAHGFDLADYPNL